MGRGGAPWIFTINGNDLPVSFTFVDHTQNTQHFDRPHFALHCMYQHERTRMGTHMGTRMGTGTDNTQIHIYIYTIRTYTPAHRCTIKFLQTSKHTYIYTPYGHIHPHTCTNLNIYTHTHTKIIRFPLFQHVYPREPCI